MSIKIFTGTKKEIEEQLEAWYTHISQYLGWCKSCEDDGYTLITLVGDGVDPKIAPSGRIRELAQQRWVTDPLAG